MSCESKMDPEKCKMDPEKCKICETTNYVASSLQPEGDVSDAPAKGVFSSGKHLCVIQDGKIIPVNVVRIELEKVYFHLQFIDEYDGTLSEWEMYVGTIIKGKPPVDYLEDKYSTDFYISVDES